MLSEEEIIDKIESIRNKFDLKKSKLGEAAGYKGSSPSQSASYTSLIKQKTDLSVSHLNGIAHFLDLPVGYFLFGDRSSVLQTIDEEAFVQKLNQCIAQEDLKPRGERKTRTQFGACVGYADHGTAQFNTANRILKGKSRIKVCYLSRIAEFFDKPIDYFLFAEA